MSTNSFETFNSAFESPFAGTTEENTSNPFANPAEEAAETTTPPETVVEGAVVEGEKKKRGRKKQEVDENGEVIKREMAPRLDAERKAFVVKNYATMGSDKVAEELKVNVNQVRNTISQFRKDMLKRIENSTSEEEKEKYTKFINVFLPKRVTGESEGGEGKKRERKASNQAIIDDLLKDLMI